MKPKSFDFESPELTKRIITSLVARLWDPIGHLLPVGSAGRVLVALGKGINDRAKGGAVGPAAQLGRPAQIGRSVGEQSPNAGSVGVRGEVSPLPVGWTPWTSLWVWFGHPWNTGFSSLGF